MSSRFAICLVLSLSLALSLISESAARVPPKCPPAGSETVFFPDDESCSKYWMCSNGWPNQLECPAPLHWDQARLICNMPNEANCQVTTQPPTTESDPEQK